MNPTINGTLVRVFRLSATAEEHEFRNRPKDKEASFESIGEIKAQAVWYSHEELQRFQSVDRIKADGYFIFKNITLKKLGINPSPSGANWNRYRFQPNINGEYGTRILEVVEMRPESPHRGTFRLWYAYFQEIRPEGFIAETESPAEENEDLDKDVDALVDKVTVYHD